MQGAVTLGNRYHRQGRLLSFAGWPCGTGAIRSRKAPIVLIFREYGDWGFTKSAKDRDRPVFPRRQHRFRRAKGELTLVDSSRMEWMPNVVRRGYTAFSET